MFVWARLILKIAPFLQRYWLAVGRLPLEIFTFRASWTCLGEREGAAGWVGSFTLFNHTVWYDPISEIPHHSPSQILWTQQKMTNRYVFFRIFLSVYLGCRPLWGTEIWENGWKRHWGILGVRGCFVGKWSWAVRDHWILSPLPSLPLYPSNHHHPLFSPLTPWKNFQCEQRNFPTSHGPCSPTCCSLQFQILSET